MTKETTVEEILTNRPKTHGDFSIGAKICQDLLAIAMASPNWHKLSPVQKEVFHMDFHKTQRILTGDHDHMDHWDDKSGYNELARKDVMRRIAARGVPAAEWDEGEHEGCGVDTERAVKALESR